LNEQIWDIVTKRWNLKILRSLDTKHPIRFNALKQMISGISSNLLSDRLHELEKLGFVKKIISSKSTFQFGYLLDEIY
jgi:DNA-binding HxlR family transcriptional regulator